jgi:hypothetical protein
MIALPDYYSEKKFVGLDPSSAIPTCARGDLAHFSSQKKSDRICAQFLTHPTMCSDEFHRFPTFHNQGNACIFVILNGHLVKEAIHGEPSPLALTGEPTVFGLVTIYEKARNTMKFLSAPRMGVIGLLADPSLSRCWGTRNRAFTYQKIKSGYAKDAGSKTSRSSKSYFLSLGIAFSLGTLRCYESFLCETSRTIPRRNLKGECYSPGRFRLGIRTKGFGVSNT